MSDLYPYQSIGSDFLVERDAAYLGDDCGLGKTPQACDAARRLRPKSTLVVAPASALEGWRRAWKRWGPAKGLFAALSYEDKRVDQLAGDFDLVIPDEAHYMKRAIRQRTKRVLGVAAKANTAWLLSGTPMPNGNPYELYAPIKVLWPWIPEALGIQKAREWAETFCVMTDTRYGPRVTGIKNADKLRPYLKQIMLRRKECEVGLQLPELRIDLHYLDRDDGALDGALVEAGYDPETLARQIDAETFAEWGSDSRLRRLLGTQKAPAIGAVLAEELTMGMYDQLVVFAYHRDTLAILRKALTKFGLVYLDGSVPQSQRQRLIDSFTGGDARVFLAQQGSAGTSLNLQTSCEVVLAEPDWVPDNNWQFVKRIHRVGQTRACRARIFAVAGSRDEDIMGSNARKIRDRGSFGL